MAREVILCQAGHLVLRGDKGVKLAPAVETGGVALGNTPAQRYGSLIQNEVDVFGLAAGEVSGSVGGDRLWGADDLDVETSSKGSDMGDGEVVGARIGGVREDGRGKLTQSEGG